MTNESNDSALPAPTPEQPPVEPEKTSETADRPAVETPEQALVKPAAESVKKVSAEKTAAEKKPAGGKKSTPAEKPAPRKRATLGAVLSALGLMLLEIVLPVIVSAVLLWWIFATFNMWSYNHTLALVVFAAGMVAFSLLISVMLDSATRRTRKKQRSAGVRFTSSPLARLITMALGGVILPLAVYAAASLVTLSAPLPVRGTVMNYIISSSAQPVKLAPPDEVGAMALDSEDPLTKTLSIQVLKGFKSPQALGQLIRLASEDKASLSNPAVSDALSNAIASYGTEARDPLILLFKSVDPAQAGSMETGDTYTQYFANTFDQLKSDIKSSELTSDDQATRLAEVDAAAAQLKTALKDIPTEKTSGNPRPAFALKTLLAADIKEDPDLLSFAKSVAADQGYPASIRGDAMLLIGKLGAKTDLDVLYPYLKEKDTVIQVHALQAIADLQAKVNGAAPTPSASQ